MNKKIKLSVLLLSLMVAVMSVGYAAYSVTLNLVGTSTIASSSWDVHFENIKSGTVDQGYTLATATTEPTISNDKHDITFSVTLDYKEEYTFNVDVKNAGTISAYLDTYAIGIDGTNKNANVWNNDYLSYSVVWTDTGNSFTQGDTLAPGSTRNVTVTLKYTSANNSKNDETHTFSLKQNWIQGGTFTKGESITTTPFNAYTITYDGTTNGGNSLQTSTLENNDLASLAKVVTKEGYSFVGWNTDENATEGLNSYSVSKNATLYAIFRKNITATFNMVDSSAGTLSSKTVSCYLYNNETSCNITTPGITANEGYTILGYSTTSGSTTAEVGVSSSVSITGDITYYSVTRKTTALNGTFYYGSGDTITNEVSSCYLFNGAVNCTVNPSSSSISSTYKGSTFIDYSTNSSSNVTISNYTITEDTSFYGYYEQVVSLTYKDGAYTTSGSSNTSVTTSKIKYVLSSTGDNSEIPSITLKDVSVSSGWNALGYRADTNTTTQTYTSGSKYTLSSSITMYGIYSRVLTLTYDEQGGSAVSDASGTQYMNSVGGYSNITITLPTSTRTNYSLTGWSINNTTYSPNTTVTINDSTTATAVWVQICLYSIGQTWNYDYTGSAQTFTVPTGCSGTYKLESWGAQGLNGGYGGYSVGFINLSVLESIYATVGKTGTGSFGGGEASYILSASGVLSSFNNDRSKILLVSGGGGGFDPQNHTGYGGAGGGYIGNQGYSCWGSACGYAYGGSQTSDGSYSRLYECSKDSVAFGQQSYAGGGGYYGGWGRCGYAGGGGSGYIGNSSLTNKHMTCYNCATSTDASTYTNSTTNVSSTAISDYAKSGNGYARITLVSIS